MSRNKVFDDLQIATEAASFNGTIKDFAKMKGCSDKTVYVAMQKCGIKKPRFKVKRKRRLNIDVDTGIDAMELPYIEIKKHGSLSINDIRFALTEAGCYGNALVKICLDDSDEQPDDDSARIYIVEDLPEDISSHFQKLD